MRFLKVDFYPLFFVVAYIGIGVSLSFWGPILYENYEKTDVALYMTLFFAIFALGYTLGIMTFTPYRTAGTPDVCREQRLHKRILFWVKISIVIIFISQFGQLLISLLQGSLNLSISKMGEAYVNFYKNYERGMGQVQLLFLIQTLTYIPYLVTLILGVFYYSVLPRRYRFMVVFVYLSVVVLETIGHGKQKQLGDLFVFLLVVYIMKVGIEFPHIRKKLFKNALFLGALGAVSLITVLYFRYQALGIDASNINDRVHPLMYYDTNHPLFHLLGYKLGFPVAVFSGYLSQGYYGLSLAMQEPFVWTYFVGNSYALTVFLNRFLGIPVDFHDTYPYRAAHTGWDDTKWSSVFTWYAGDFTFWGTLVFFGIVAFFYAKVWKEAYRYHNPLSIILFANLTIGLLYIPANNQLLHTPGSVMAMFFFVITWLLVHRKYNFNFRFDKKYR